MGVNAVQAKQPHEHVKDHPSSPCQTEVTLTEEAERQPGGALYSGPAKGHEHKHGAPVPAMKGAHADHAARHGGAFFMAPDKIHHLEAAYSPRCGFRLFLFNAFTKPIAVGRFRAFIKVIPDREDEAEIIRFLSPNKTGAVLAAPVGDTVSPPFKIELFLKFPEADEPELFSVHISK